MASKQKDHAGKTLLLKTLATGCATAFLYFGLFWNQAAIMENFTKGGYYAALPVLTAFLFSVVHGAFASNLLSVFGIRARTVVSQERAKPPP